MGTHNEKGIDSSLFAVIDRQILLLKSKILPAGPFLLLVDDQTSYPYADSNQCRGTPFQPYELRHLQYLTMMSGGNRGLALPFGDWHDEIESCSPAAIALQIQGPPASSKGIKAPSKKLSIADYKKLRQDGPSKQPGDICEIRSRASSNAPSEPMSRGPSSETTQNTKTVDILSKGNGARLLISQLAGHKMEAKRLALQNFNPSNVNGNLSTNTNTSASIRPVPDAPIAKPKLRSPLRTAMKHPLPPRPQSPPRNGDVKLPYNNFRQPKRLTDHTFVSSRTDPQRRFKDEAQSHSPAAKDSNLRKVVNSSQPIASSTGISAKSSFKPSLSSPLFQKDVISITNNKKTMQQSLIPIPPLLSPLPADLDDCAEMALQTPSSANIDGRKSASSTNAVQTNISCNSSSISISVKNKSRSSSPAFVHPPLLSPDLPPIVEQELSRLQKKNSNIYGNEARHEKAQKLDTFSVVRKNSKVGHPPKRSLDHSKSNVITKNMPAAINTGTDEDKKSFLVKIRYKKRRAKDIERILRMTPKASSTRYQDLEAQRSANSSDKKQAIDDSGTPREVADSTSVTVSKISQVAPSKKRTSKNSEDLPSPAKRTKVHNDVPLKSKTSRDPLRSPALNQDSHLLTPKKPDMKGINMRKIPSTDGNNAHSPNVSTPLPAEKRIFAKNTSTSNQTIRSDFGRFLSEALTLKRKMDSELKTKDLDARKFLSDNETQAGLCTGIECLLAYYSAFSFSKDKTPSSRATSWESTLGLLEFVYRASESFLLLQTLAVQLSALIREELNRSYLEHVSISKEASSEMLEKIVKNAQNRDRFWALSSRGREALQKLGFVESVGPWTSWRDGRDYFLGVLAKYEDTEKLGWKASFK